MAASDDPWQFSSSPLSARDCRVLAFAGEEALGEGYVFDILLLASKVEMKQARDMQEALMRASLLTLTGRAAAGALFSWNGTAQEVTYAFSSKAGAVYEVRMRPRAWKLTHSVHSHIFLNMPLPKLLGKLLTEEGLIAGTDFADDMERSYKARPFTCRYNENAFAFLSRGLERMGGYTYIRQTDDGDVLVLADGKSAPDALAPADTLDMRRKDGPPEAVYAFTRTLAAAHGTIGLRDYSSEKPGLTTGSAEAASDAPWRRGKHAVYGMYDLFGELDCFNRAFAAEDANARADELAEACLAAEACKADTARGRSTVPWLRAGCVFRLDGEEYQLLRVRHKFFIPRDELETKIAELARQEGLIAGEDGKPGYRNAFVCRPRSSGPYAPERRTPRPVMSGVVNAEIDASGSGEYAELDDKGRYKVKFPFAEKVFYADSDNPGNGNNSIPLRMLQAHAGTNSGIHFPLLKGAEVLVGFIHGDPDRPVILGTLPNAANVSPVADVNRQTNVISTPGGNSITMVDTRGQQAMHMESADKKTRISLTMSK
ncbi:MAG: type VI secretion system tip protein VgrG [Desulfovibrio sp.]|jgi:type VI secretion system secreted protein VgrG|nr:type VI secretion system tip protein VgrG [Desulfovibrio sp.]